MYTAGSSLGTVSFLGWDTGAGGLRTTVEPWNLGDGRREARARTQDGCDIAALR